MRSLSVIAPLAAGFALSACASTSGPDRYETELQRLTDTCRERGGILVPTGRQTGRPQTDNVCEIRNEPGRLRGG